MAYKFPQAVISLWQGKKIRKGVFLDKCTNDYISVK